MAYNADIPQPTDDPSQSQDQILKNFQEINTIIGINHDSFSDTDPGKHKFLQLPEQVSAPATAADEGGLYTKVVSAATQLFYREESSGSERQLTSAFTAATNGTVTIPGGLMIQWGLATSLANDSAITFPTPFTTAVYSIQCTLRRGDASSRFVYVSSGTESVTGFNIKTNSSSTDVYWYAIGL